MTQDQIDALRILSAFDATYDDPNYQEMNARSDLSFKANALFHPVQR